MEVGVCQWCCWHSLYISVISANHVAMYVIKIISIIHYIRNWQPLLFQSLTVGIPVLLPVLQGPLCCERVTSQPDRFSDLSVSFPEIEIPVTLKSMLDLYFSPEDLETKIDCEYCDMSSTKLLNLCNCWQFTWRDLVLRRKAKNRKRSPIMFLSHSVDWLWRMRHILYPASSLTMEEQWRADTTLHIASIEVTYLGITMMTLR